MALLETLHAARPNHRLVAADFDSLPETTIAGERSPLVASQARPTSHWFPYDPVGVVNVDP